jgi:hypothetical protein
LFPEILAGFRRLIGIRAQIHTRCHNRA